MAGHQDRSGFVSGAYAGPERRRTPERRHLHTVIATKLTMPSAPPLALDRGRLDRLLDAGLEGPLTVVVAPAGYGKTVAAAGRLAWDIERTSAWVSLDAADDEPARFWTYVIEALTGAGLDLPAAASPVERVGLGGPGEVVAPLVNALAAWSADVTLVIDDLHFITSEDIHQQLAFLVQQRLPTLHLLLLSRSDPPLLTPRLIASGDAVRIGVRELAFDLDETTEFLRSQDLDPGLADVVFDRLGGWPAALRLLRLWIAGQDDAAEAVARFAGHDEIVADYLAVEVLQQLEPELRRFLAATSILGRLSGALCDAVTGADDGARTLLDLQRRGFFVDAIDPANTWFRYHHLFGELLGRELAAADPEVVQDLHRRASTWFATQGHGEEAIEHAIAARDWDALHDLVLVELLAIGTRYHFPIVERWLAAVPAEIKARSATYLMLDGFVQGSTGRLDAARSSLERAEAQLVDGGRSDGSNGIAALVVTVQAGIARLDADLAAARRFAAAADARLEAIDGDPNGHARLARVATTISLASTLFWHGDLLGADERLAEMQAIATRDGMERMQVSAMAARSLVLAATGHLDEAQELAERCLDLAAPAGALDSFQANPAHLTEALVVLHRGEHLAGRDAFSAVAERAERHGDRAPTMVANLALTHLAMVTGDLALAASHLGATRATWPSWTPPPPLASAERIARARLALALDDPAGVEHRHHPVEIGLPSSPLAAGQRINDELSERERTVYRLLARTMSNAEIAVALDITPNTLKTHVKNIYRKLGVTDRAGALAASATLA